MIRIVFLREILNPLNAELNPICNFLALFETHHILHVSRIRVKLVESGEDLSISVFRVSECIFICIFVETDCVSENIQVLTWKLNA